MKFTKFGKALLMSALSAGVVLSITSCVQSYTVGFLYVTGTTTAQTTGEGVISGFKIDHNTGKLTNIAGLPVASGGSNPGRSVLVLQRFLYVLNRGTNSSGGSTCTASDPCNANITQFAIGGNGILTPQETFFTQGVNPFRIIADASGTFLFVLDENSPVTLADGKTVVGSSTTNPDANCALALGTGVSVCGDITAYKIDSTTGRLSLVVNAQVTQSSGQALPYFPVPADPIDFTLSSTYILTLSGNSTSGDSVFPYTYSGGTGQLTVNQNSAQPLGIHAGTAIINTSASVIYVLDNEPLTYTPTDSSTPVTVPSQILPFTVGTNGALQAETNGVVPDDVTQSNPVYLIVESHQSKWVYVANFGNNTDPNNAQSGIAGYTINNPFQLTPLPNFGATFGTGSGPVCVVEDPSQQFIYTANFNDSSVTAGSIDQRAGALRPLSQITKAKDNYGLPGPAAWCVVSGRTN